MNGCFLGLILLPILFIYYLAKAIGVHIEEHERKKQQREFEKQRILQNEAWERRKSYLKDKYKSLTVEEIIFNKEIENIEKVFLLQEIHNYQYDEAQELIDTAVKEARKAKLSEAKRKIAQKAQEIYSTLPSDDPRKPIPDDVKMFVWQRDKGQCVKCYSQENLEYDHIIPLSKGGSNTERNIQLLCEKCNREKHNKIV